MGTAIHHLLEGFLYIFCLSSGSYSFYLLRRQDSTCDLKVMNLASYQLLYSAILRPLQDLNLRLKVDELPRL